MTRILDGVRVLEVAEHTFVPAASAVLADYGAEVIKIEHVERGDAMRGLDPSAMMGLADHPVHIWLEHSNRGKRSIGLDLASDEGRALVHRIAATCDVFITNKLPGLREKLGIDLEQIRAANPSIVYVRGTGQGERGPDANRGSYDSLAFWARAGIAKGVARGDEGDEPPPPPGPAFGDSIGAFTIAGGVMGALFHRERTGEATTVDVSLLGVGMWAQSMAICMSQIAGMPWSMAGGGTISRNPLARTYTSADGELMAFSCLQTDPYWAPLCTLIGRPELAHDPRFEGYDALMANADEAATALAEAFAGHTALEWRERLAPFRGQWCIVQDSLAAGTDPQAIANGYLTEVVNAKGVSFPLTTAPVQYDEQPAPPGRAPEFNEHADEILAELGLDEQTVLDLRIKGVVA
jgi:crotonobetainyl-CoA:carnitine CoA-transferase CaiB-like acyl-CoA transferase